MSIDRMADLRRGVSNVATYEPFFSSLVLQLETGDGEIARFHTDKGSSIGILAEGAAGFSRGNIVGLGVHEIVWGVDTPRHAGGETERGPDADNLDDEWFPCGWSVPLFGYAYFGHNLALFFEDSPESKPGFLEASVAFDAFADVTTTESE